MNGKSGSISFLGMLQIVFIILKILGYIDSWYIAFIPLIIHTVGLLIFSL